MNSLGAYRIVTLLAITTATASAETNFYADRAAFLNAVGNSFTDGFSTYGAPANSWLQLSDNAMSAVLGETEFLSVTFDNLNLVGNVSARGDGTAYCAGCNGNFRLGFWATSLTNDGGVFGVALDIVIHTSRRVSLGDDDPANPSYDGTILVQFADGSTAEVVIPADIGYYEPSMYFLGLTDERGIAAITIGTEPLASRHSWVIDNLTIASSKVTEVAIDVKPGSFPNCFNLNDHGVIPVAILGSDVTDVTAIDVLSLTFGGLSVRVRGDRRPLCAVDYSNDDSYPDLICQFEDDPSSWIAGDGETTLSGALLGGGLFEGRDSICIAPR